MNDRNLMQDLLLLEKGCCDLYMHGAVESSDTGVHRAFKTSFNDSLSMQNEIYTKMSEKGWYTNKQTDQQKVDQLRQQFSPSAQ